MAVRHLVKSKGFSALNIFGLAAGLAVCLLILLYVLDELQYDRYNLKAGRIYRIDNQMRVGDVYFDVAQVPPAVGPVFKRDFPQVEQFLRFRNRGGFVVTRGAESFEENKVIYVDSTLFDVFSLPLVAGNPRTALTAPNSMVITEAIAEKYFHRTDVVGESLVINGGIPYRITGVLRGVPPTSHFHYDFFVAMAGVNQSREDNWVSQNFNTYVVLKPGVDPRQMEPAFNATLVRYAEPQMAKLLNVDGEGLKKSGSFARCSLTPLTSIHLYAHKPGELEANGSIQYVYIFSAIALFILLIACVNFMNLSTARSAERAREVGVRKVLGSERRSLIVQFLVESVLISFLSLVVAFFLAWLLLPLLNQLTQKSIPSGTLFTFRLLACAFGGMLMVGLLAGLYPALYLSGFKPVEVLKGKTARGLRVSGLRNALVVFQFTISVLLIIGTIVIYSQLTYLLHLDMGFNKDQLLVIRNTQQLKDQVGSFRNEVSRLPGVLNATMTGFLPVDGDRSNDIFFPDASLNAKRSISMQKWGVDADYVPTLQIKMIKGRNFSPVLPTDSGCFIINEAAAALLDKGDPLRQMLYEVDDSNHATRYPIIGVFRNFNFNSLRDPVTPLALHLGTEKRRITLRVATASVTGLLTEIRDKWKRIAHSQPFDYSFLNETFAAQYVSERRIGKIAVTFSVLALLIACLGLFALVTYATGQRTKEIGIRKVLGASVVQLWGLLSREFLVLVGIAFCIAAPLAWVFLHQWLQGYAYRVSISGWVFVEAGVCGLVVTLVTVSWQAVRAARMNPVGALRD